jgi:malate dehydrogenase
MSTVTIVGAGELGGAVAQTLAASGRVARVVLIDAAAHAAAGKALDIQQSGALDRFGTALEGTDDVTRVTGAGVCVIADRFGPPAAEWDGDDGVALLSRVVSYSATAPIVFAGARQADLMLRTAREAGVAGTRLVGSAAEAFASAVRAIVALEAQCSPNDVMLAVLGSPPFVVAWTEASIGGYSLERVLSQAQIARIEARAVRLWPPGPYALGAAASRIVRAIAGSARARLIALTVLGGEFGVRNRIGALPVLFNERGIADVRVPALNTRERVLVEISLGAP